MANKLERKDMGTPNRIRTQIDFRPTRGQQDADLLYTVLMHYNRGGRTSMTASQLITVAYTNYDPSESPIITKILDVRTRAKAFIKHFGILKKSDIRKVIESHPENYAEGLLLEPDKKFVCFDGDDPDAKKLWSVLDAVRFRDRGILINMWLYQYFAHGNCEYYNRLCAIGLFCWLKEEYTYMRDINTARLNTVINSLWVNSSDFKEEDLPGEEEIPQEEKDELRVLMGIAEERINPTF